jgi:hypothetical protein
MTIQSISTYGNSIAIAPISSSGMPCDQRCRGPIVALLRQGIRTLYLDLCNHVRDEGSHQHFRGFTTSLALKNWQVIVRTLHSFAISANWDVAICEAKLLLRWAFAVG